MGGRRDAYRVLVGRPEGRRPLERRRHGWEDSIKMYPQEVGWGGTALISVEKVKEVRLPIEASVHF
jgi:hypothetical protein